MMFCSHPSPFLRLYHILSFFCFVVVPFCVKMEKFLNSTVFDPEVAREAFAMCEFFLRSNNVHQTLCVLFEVRQTA